MLKCVVFIVTSYGYQLLSDNIAQMRKMLSEKEVGLKVETSQIYPEGILPEDLLFVTDCPEQWKLLLKKGCYTAVFCHDKNRNASFEGASYVVEQVPELSFSAYDEAYRRLAGIPLEILETEHLVVRESMLSDLEAFYRIYASPEAERFLDPLSMDREEEKANLEGYIKQYYGFYGFGMWTVLYKETGQVIGRAGFRMRQDYELPELGFVLDKDFWGRGLAYEVCKSVLDYAEKVLCWEEVQAFAAQENTASRKLLLKLGFREREALFIKDRAYLRMTMALL